MLKFNKSLKWYKKFEEVNKKEKPIVLTRHALDRIINRGGTVNPKDIVKGEVVEVETDDNVKEITKFLVRCEYGRQHVVIVILNYPDRWVVKTAWINHKYDNHNTLDTKGYVIA